MWLTSNLPPLSTERAEMDTITYSLLTIILWGFLHSTKSKNIASWVFPCQVTCGNWPFVPRNLGKHLSLLIDLEL